MANVIDADICVIGAGSAGLSVAAGASQMGARVVLVEKGEMGGDCLNYGCVPSKALLAAGHAAHAGAVAPKYGVSLGSASYDPVAVHDHVKGVIAAIAPMDSVERFESFGVTVIKAAARFTGPQEVMAGDTRITARRFVIATGSSPVAPPIEGLSETPYFTNETLFDNKDRIDHLLIIGGGPIGLEMAQAHRQLGIAVTVVDLGPILPKDDPDAVEVVRKSVLEDGVVLHEKVKVIRTDKTAQGVSVTIETKGAEKTITGSHLLVAAGRAANVKGLDLEKAGVDYDRAIKVDKRLRTSNRKIFAMGDVAGSYQFTHVAGYHAGVVIRNILFRLPAKVDYRAVPWVTYTDPELAHVGMTLDEAKQEQGDNLRILHWGFDENDRAQSERSTEGFVKVLTTRKGHILGATIVGKNAGELIHPWIIAIQNKLKIGAMATYIAPYPTLGEVNKRAAGSFYTEKLFSERTRKIVRFLLRFG
ncbi:FAD-binding protein [Alphaproteobacteria bacterium HT1-32]|nr:FAD-binding protein [Alphaproteobacteria bacterium HT1-32]